MANICENKFYIYCSEENTEKISNKLEELFSDTLNGEITYEDESIIEGDFDSRWCFPDEIFNDFFEEFEDDEDSYMRCLSEEYGCQLVSMNIYRDGGWTEPQYFDL